MIGHNIQRLRQKKGWTQKQLAEKLFVSAQAVSRWENNEVEPSLSTITELVKIFEVPVDELLGLQDKAEQAPPPPPQQRIVVQKEYVYREPPKTVLALCESCNRPLYHPSDIYRRNGSHIYCKACHEDIRKRILEQEQREMEERQLEILTIARKRRIRSFVWGGLALVVLLLLWGAGNGFATVGDGLLGVVYAVSLFTLLSCCILGNNFLGEMMFTIFSWGFVKMPGLIFSLDIDGCLWFIAVKLLLAVISLALMAVFGILAIIVGGIVSWFVYPYAILQNFQHPEKIN